MPVHAPFKLLALLALSLSPLAAAAAALAKRDDYTWAPGSVPFDKCETEEHHAADGPSSGAPLADCLAIGDWARATQGEWILRYTDDMWRPLQRASNGSCEVVAKTTQQTMVGNVDVADFIDSIRSEPGPTVDIMGTFGACQAGANVDFWLRYK
ncbi:hypothetical protein GGS24DRAFT_502481 [Hypoxylon argillaceum]|nr:hypothetical protein GGS24DRAFT_502481 [Hypoxylon argillaceum]KAI1155724.1 hypothetical protein F4825DRAFT_447206 [Nemania diffusa]